ncbi:MAG: hypothetical protein CMP19_10835 [Rickettsiales bacterium]|nr:hypothetical protein [Rickettsiales bacterium]
MTGIYKTGTIALNNNSNIVTGTGTLFQTVANAREGDLFTLDGNTLYEIYQVDTETQLRIRNLVTGTKYQGASVSGVNYAIVRNFAASTDAQIASDVVNLQQRWHEREREMTEWFASDANYHQITDIKGDKVLVITPAGLDSLVDGPVSIEDFGFLSAKESLSNDLDAFNSGVFFSREIALSGQPDDFGSGRKLVLTNSSDHAYYQQVIELSTGKSRFRVASSVSEAEEWRTMGEIIDVVPLDKLPSQVTDIRRTIANSPPVNQQQNLTHKLIDYPTLKKTDVVPTESPNNKREMLFDDVRQRAYISLTESWLPIPNVIATREFLVCTGNRGIKFNSAYTGNISYRVYPMGTGGQGLPNSQSLNNFEWHYITDTVTDLATFCMGFVGIIEFIKTDYGFQRFSSSQSHFPSINAFYADNNGNIASNQFVEFSLRQDGHWYSNDITPETPYSLGSSWVQDIENKRLYTVTNASEGSDALRFFGDDYDDYPLEVVLISTVTNAMAITISNSTPFISYYSGTYVFLTTERLYLKRNVGYAPITGTVEIESIRIRVANYG